ncbi:MAG: signal peptide peptidase SppA [Candidatus Harrisonbacteria bacterium]|nr:signal peptide peptidase SppA [Candidatus Harrisonbacteria bacterium]
MDESKREELTDSGYSWNFLWYALPAAFILLVGYQSCRKNKNYNSNLEAGIPPGVNLYSQPISSATAKEKIAVISIQGEISPKNNMVEITIAKLKSAATDPDIKAVILKIESPGGDVNSTNLIWNEINKLKTSKKPVIAFFNYIAASGAYYISAPADKIVSTPETWTGSIGVIFQSLNLYGLTEKLGVKMMTIKSAANKDMLSPYRQPEPEGEKIMQALVNESYDAFVGVVSQGRKMNEVKVRKLADGRIYSARQAKENGLVDEIGYFEDAVKLAKQLSKSEEASVVEIQERISFSGLFFNQFLTKNDSPPLKSMEKLLPKSGLYYIDPALLIMYQSNH